MSPTGYGRVEGAALSALQAHFGDRLSLNNVVREQHGVSLAAHPPGKPDAVAFVENEEDVVAAVRVCAGHRIPMVPFAAGSSLEGQTIPVHGGLSLDMTRMNRILEVHPEDMDAVVEPGVTRIQLNDHLRDSGLFFPVDPGADASLGGMASTRASGTNAVRYGTMREAVTALRVVTADGRIVRTGTRARKSSAGYDLTKLFVGSEGTLGVITRVTVRLQGQPEAVAAAVVSFNELSGAVDTAIMALQSNIPIARVELLDENQIDACNRYSKLNLAVKPTLFVEFHGTQASVAEQAERFGEIARDCGGSDFSWAEKPEDRTRLWKARHDVAWASYAYRPGWKQVIGDVCVPISRLTECVVAARAAADRAGLLGMIVGHVGDGNFHAGIFFDPAEEGAHARAKAVSDEIVGLALAMGGTCTGEHGIGLGKGRYLEKEHGAEALDLMRMLKATFDPQNILNPGKWIAPNAVG
jgi:D-lactate dehydrogenase (cytochrome)